MGPENLPVNEEIRPHQVIVISEEGKNLGVMKREEALRLAGEKGLDLVMVAPREIPVCRLMNYEKYLYQKEKRMKEIGKTHRKNIPKEVKLGIRIGPMDFEIKMNRIREFLSEGRKVRVIIEFRGWRELAHTDQGYEKIQKIKEIFKDLAKVESDVKRDGRRIYMILSSKKEARMPEGKTS